MKRPGFKKILTAIFYLFLAGILFCAALFIYFSKDLPDPSKISERQVVQSTKIYDRTGTVLLYDVHGEEKRTVVPFDQISQHLKDATVATEDATFYQNFGIDLKGIARAAWGYITGNRSAGGGSTITQQFIKNSLLTSQHSLTRKIKEAILAIEMDAKFSKDQILGFYLNEIPYGSNAYGAEAAAQTFFGKNAKDLDIAESALIAALPQLPTYYSPYGSHLDALKARQEYILDRMQKLGYISADEAAAAKKEKLAFASQDQKGIKAPHFVMYIKEYLEQKYGAQTVESGGLKVYTTLDWDLQQTAEQVVKAGAQTNTKKYGAYNAALTALDPKTGQVLAMVGSADYFATSSLPKGCEAGNNCKFEPNFNVAISGRQPGSSFKPFAYAVAFKKGFTPDTVLFDLTTEFNPSCPSDASLDFEPNGLACYHPHDYDGLTRGPVSLRTALDESLNIPSVKVLYLAGIPQTIDLAHQMGITTLQNENAYGLALVLGGGEVKLLDETAAYSVFAADGNRNPETAILKIEDGQGNVLEQYQQQTQQVLDPQVARRINDVLSDNAARTPIFGANSPLHIQERQTAVKTGTTNEYKDAWTVGYTPSLAVGVWAGNNDNTPMSAAGAGLYAAAPLWHDFMEKAYKLKSGTSTSSTLPNAFILPPDSSPEQFVKPEAATSTNPALNGQIFANQMVKIDKVSGKLATDLTPPDQIEEIPFQQIHTILYYVDKNDPLGPAPQNPTIDPQYSNWDAPIQIWAASSGWKPQLPPTDYDDIHTLANQPTVSIMSPSDGQNIYQKTFPIYISAQANLGIKQIDFFFDDKLIGVATQQPYQINYTLPDTIVGADHTITVRAYDTDYNRQEASSNIFIAAPDVIIQQAPVDQSPPTTVPSPQMNP